MAEIIYMPKLSDTMTEGVVAEWHKKVGDEVESGELLAEIETDKATMEFESFQDGVLLHIGVEKGQSAPVDSILCVLGEKGEDITDLLKNDQGAGTQEAAPVETPKEVTPSPAPAATPAPAPSPAPVAAAVASTPSNGRVKASPLAKKIAEDKGINLEQVSGSGDGGRVVKRDVENFVPAAQSAAPSFAAVSGQESYTEVPVSQMRKTIARRLAESKFTAPHFYLTVSIDMDNAMAARKMANSNEDVRISFNEKMEHRVT